MEDAVPVHREPTEGNCCGRNSVSEEGGREGRRGGTHIWQHREAAISTTGREGGSTGIHSHHSFSTATIQICSRFLLPDTGASPTGHLATAGLTRGEEGRQGGREGGREGRSIAHNTCSHSHIH